MFLTIAAMVGGLVGGAVAALWWAASVLGGFGGPTEEQAFALVVALAITFPGIGLVLMMWLDR